MQSRRQVAALPHEKHLQEYRGRESYEQQSDTGRGGRSGAFPQRDFPRYAERHPQPLETEEDEYCGLDDDYSRTDYGPRRYNAQTSEPQPKHARARGPRP